MSWLWWTLKAAIALCLVYLSYPYDFCKRSFEPLIQKTISSKWLSTISDRCKTSKLVFQGMATAAIVLTILLQFGRGFSSSERNQKYHLMMALPIVLGTMLTLVEAFLTPTSTVPHYMIGLLISAMSAYVAVISAHNLGESVKLPWLTKLKAVDILMIGAFVTLACVLVAGRGKQRSLALFEYGVLALFILVGIMLL